MSRTIQWEHLPDVRNRHSSSSSSQSPLPDHVETSEGVVPTALGRYQVCKTRSSLLVCVNNITWNKSVV